MEEQGCSLIQDQMKKLCLLVVLVTGLTGFYAEVQAQKYAFVDSEYILKQIPAYKDAQEQLDQLSEQWQKEIEAKFAEVDQLYKAYLKEQILLTEELKQQREEAIIKKEKEAKDLQRTKFGVDGDLFTKRQELVKPIQDEVYSAIKTIAAEGNYAVIFDKANNSNIMYANERYDKSNKILEKMGVTPK